MNCRICDSSRLELAVDLGEQPWGNHFLRREEVGQEPYYPLRVVHCSQCKTAQLDYTVRKEVMFSNHTYLSGMTGALRAHFRQVAETVDREFFQSLAQKSVLDIGSNDGTQLQEFQKLGYDVLGVESSRPTAQVAIDAGVPTVNKFFNLETARAIDRTFHIINAAGVFFHLEELHSVTDAIKLCLRPDGVFVVQFIYAKGMLENLAFDQIYHEHLLYYNVTTLQVLLRQHGLELFDARLSPIHGGSMIAYATHAGVRPASEKLQWWLLHEEEHKANELETYHRFAERIQQLKIDNLAYLDDRKAQGKRIYGMGAPVKGNTLLNYFGIGQERLDCVVEINRMRDGLFTPGSHLPVRMESDVTPPDVYYVLAWNFKDEILKKNQKLLNDGVEFYFPVDPTRTAT